MSASPPSFSEAVRRGAWLTHTKGPTWDTDVYSIAFAGLHSRLPTPEEAGAFYHAPPWPGVGFGSQVEHAIRMLVMWHCTWAQVIQRLKEWGQ